MLFSAVFKRRWLYSWPWEWKRKTKKCEWIALVNMISQQKGFCRVLLNPVYCVRLDRHNSVIHQLCIQMLFFLMLLLFVISWFIKFFSAGWIITLNIAIRVGSCCACVGNHHVFQLEMEQSRIILFGFINVPPSIITGVFLHRCCCHENVVSILWECCDLSGLSLLHQPMYYTLLFCFCTTDVSFSYASKSYPPIRWLQGNWDRCSRC